MLSRACRTTPQTLKRLFSKANNYSVKEVNVSAPVGYFAGKLWEPLEQGHRNPSKLDDPPVLCLHGWLDNACSFDHLIPLLIRPGIRFLSLDLPGHGFTTYCPSSHYDYAMEGIVAIRRVVDHFAWNKFSIMGHSMGAIVGFLYSAFFPEKIHKYIGLDNIRPLPREPIEMMRSAVAVLMEVESTMERRKQSPPRGYPFDELVQKLHEARLETLSLEACETLLKRGAVPIETGISQNSGLYRYSHSLRTLIPPGHTFSASEIEDMAREVKCPVCYIKAVPGNTYDTVEEMARLTDILRESTGSRYEYHEIPGSHHFHMNDPKPLVPILTKFLIG